LLGGVCQRAPIFSFGMVDAAVSFGMDCFKSSANVLAVIDVRGARVLVPPVPATHRSLALAAATQRLPPTGPPRNLAGALADLKRYDDAATAAKEAYEVSMRTVGERSQDSLIPMNNYAVNLRKAGRLDESIAILRRVVELSGPDGGVYMPGHFQHDMFRLSLGSALIGNKQEAEGLPLVLGAYQGLKEKVGDKHYGTIRAAAALVKYYDDHGETAEADKYRDAANVK
jgi:tetratricopeptide (TPR) repeat protein